MSLKSSNFILPNGSPASVTSKKVTGWPFGRRGGLDILGPGVEWSRAQMTKSGRDGDVENNGSVSR